MVSLDMLPDLITTEEAAEYLGVGVETVRLYTKRKTNPLPIIIISPKIIRINKDYFVEWLENNAKEIK